MSGAPTAPGATRRGRATATLGDLMSTELVTLRPEATLREAIEVLRGARVGGAPVVTGGHVVGVLSASDVLDLEIDLPCVPAERTSQVEWGGLEDEDPAGLVEAGDTPPAAYFVGLWSDAGADLLERFDATDAPEWDVLEDHVVAEAMTTAVLARAPDTPVPEAAAFMLASGVHRLLVMEGERLLGVVSAMDVVRAVAEGTLGPDGPAAQA